MTAFEYLLPFVFILIGLAVADLALSLHRLLRARRRVRWDWLPLASSVLVLLLILQFWWSFYIIGRIEVWSSYSAFLLVTASLISIFLLASAALPDEVQPEGIDLRRLRCILVFRADHGLSCRPELLKKVAAAE